MRNKRYKDHPKKTLDGVDDGDPGSSVSAYFYMSNIVTDIAFGLTINSVYLHYRYNNYSSN
jgi:hypothetical protein